MGSETASKILLSSEISASSIARLHRILQVKRIPVLELVPTVEATDYCNILGREAILYKWCDGTSFQAGRMAHRQAVARLLRAFHDSDLPPEVVRPFPSVPLPLADRVAKLEALLEGIRKSFTGQAICKCLRHIADKHLPALKELERGQPDLLLSPEELRGDNCRFRGDEICCVLDLEGARRQYRIDALAQACVWHTLNPKEDLSPPPQWEDILAFREDYCSGSPSLNRAELQAFPALVALHIARAAAFWPSYLQLHATRWLELSQETLAASEAGRAETI